MDKTLLALVDLSRSLGEPEKGYAILGEGNTSARINANSFWVKASGSSLRTMDPSGLVRVRFDPVFELLAQETLTDEEVWAGLAAAKVDPAEVKVPSVETFLHAILLQLEDVNFIGHTHPTAINTILCSKKAAEAYSGSLFPDQIVYCGPAPVYIPYVDPGLPLAKAVMDAVQAYEEEWGQAPKVVMMQNHGFIALGKTAQDVENITAMSVKAAQIIAGTYALGGPNMMSPENAERIHTRPDEHYRKSVWGTK